MKIIHKKKKKKISLMQFSSPKQKYKKYSIPTHLQTTGEGVQCCALKGCFHCCLKVLCPRKTSVVQIFHLVYPN